LSICTDRLGPSKLSPVEILFSRLLTKFRVIKSG
jgi:hypothetical protein